MKKHVIKLIVCIMLISALMIGFCSAFASAEIPNRTIMQRFNAWIASAMVAANITIGSTLAPVQQVLDTLNYGEGMPWTPTYTYQGATWDNDIMNRSVIHVNPDYVTIDGVPYTDVWLSTDASQKFRTNAFDVETAWNIASNSNGTYAEGSGYIAGLPAFILNDGDTTMYTQQYTFTGTGSYEFGDLGIIIGDSTVPGKYSITSVWADGSTTRNYSEAPVPVFGRQFRAGTGSTVTSGASRALNPNTPPSPPSWSSWNNVTAVRAPVTHQSFDFDWVSGTVPVPQLEDGQGLHFLVPSSHSDSTHQYDYDFHDLVDLNPNITNPNGYEFNFDPSLNPNFELDLETNDALGAIISAVIAAYLADLLDGDGVKIEYTRNEPAPPEPGVIDPLPDPDPAPDVPEPGTTIADTDWTKLDEILRWIQSTIDSIRHLTESLQTMLDSIIEAIQDILQHISEIPDAIRELADQILEDIELGPSKLFDKALDILKTLFLPLLLPIRAMMNLWHYVVEWIQSISTPFTWIFGIMSGTSGNMVLPIYALLAGGICISIYKALGR